MKGWKTLTGGLAAIVCGMYLIIFQSERFEFGAALVSLGLMGMGIGHKIEKK